MSTLHHPLAAPKKNTIKGYKKGPSRDRALATRQAGSKHGGSIRDNMSIYRHGVEDGTESAVDMTAGEEDKQRECVTSVMSSN